MCAKSAAFSIIFDKSPCLVHEIFFVVYNRQVSNIINKHNLGD